MRTDSLLFKYAKLLILIFLILFAVYLLFDLVIMPAYTRHGQEIMVPDLTNMFYEEAREQLAERGLKIVEREKKFDKSGQFSIGVVMSQVPTPFSEVKKGRRIYVTVSKGEPDIEMPKLIYTSERNAIFTLERYDLVLGEVRYEHSDIFHAGVISEQSIEAGAEVRPGMVIDLTVSLGQFPDNFIVPDVIGRSLPDAKKIILQSGLTLGAVSFQIEPDLLPETVIDQSLEPEMEVTKGDTINLLVSQLPEKLEDEIK